MPNVSKTFDFFFPTRIKESLLFHSVHFLLTSKNSAGQNKYRRTIDGNFFFTTEAIRIFWKAFTIAVSTNQ